MILMRGKFKAKKVNEKIITLVFTKDLLTYGSVIIYSPAQFRTVIEHSCL